MSLFDLFVVMMIADAESLCAEAAGDIHAAAKAAAEYATAANAVRAITGALNGR